MTSLVRTADMADKVLRQLEGGMTLKEACRLPDMPSDAAIRRWALEDEAFGARYARAREIGAYAMADELLDVADDGSNDWTTRKRQDGSEEEVFNAEHVQRSRLRVDTRKWLLGKILPAVFGDKVQHTGADGQGPVEVVQYQLPSNGRD